MVSKFFFLLLMFASVVGYHGCRKPSGGRPSTANKCSLFRKSVLHDHFLPSQSMYLQIFHNFCTTSLFWLLHIIIILTFAQHHYSNFAHQILFRFLWNIILTFAHHYSDTSRAVNFFYSEQWDILWTVTVKSIKNDDAYYQHWSVLWMVTSIT